MTTPPTILSEQEKSDLAAHALANSWSEEGLISDTEARVLAKLAQGVELEATFWHDDETGEVIAASMHGGGASFEALIPLSTAQAAVAAERAKASRALDLLDIAVTLYEDGTECYEDPEDEVGYMGRAFKWPHPEFDEACALLDRERPRNAPPDPAPAAEPVPADRAALADEAVQLLKLLHRVIGQPEFNGYWWNVVNAIKRLASSAAQVPEGRVPGFIKPDTDDAVFFYEQDFYVLSNFSAFALEWKDHLFPTSEHAYHWEKFRGSRHPDAYYVASLLSAIRNAPSAHEAFTLAQRAGDLRRPDWDDVKVDVMRDLLRAKVRQHEYVRRKLLATGDRELIEDSWRDDFWGWGPNRDGQNMLGKLWMEIRAELAAVVAAPAAGGEHG